MSVTTRYLDRVKKAMTLPSDYALAKALRVTPQAVAQLRGGRAASDETALRIADLLKLDAVIVLSEIREDSARTPEHKSMWRRLRGVAAAIIVAGLCSFALLTQIAQASAVGMYIM